MDEQPVSAAPPKHPLPDLRKLWPQDGGLAKYKKFALVGFAGIVFLLFIFGQSATTPAPQPTVNQNQIAKSLPPTSIRIGQIMQDMQGQTQQMEADQQDIAKQRQQLEQQRQELQTRLAAMNTQVNGPTVGAGYQSAPAEAEGGVAAKPARVFVSNIVQDLRQPAVTSER